MTKAITRFIDVVITKERPRVSTAVFDILMAITDSPFVTTSTRTQSFTTLADVTAFFGVASEEELAADAYFNQDPELTNQPNQLIFGRYADAVTAATIECGSSPETDFEVWKLVSDGEFACTIDGSLEEFAALDFTAVTSMADVASVIHTALAADGDCAWRVNRFVINSGTTGAASTITLLDTVAAPAGTDISGSAYLDGDVIYSVTNTGGSVLSQGQVAETFAVALAAIEAKDSSWAGMAALKKFRDLTAAEDMAIAMESREKMFCIATNDANTLVSGDTSHFAYYLKNLNYGRTAVIYHDNSVLYPDFSWLGQQMPKDLGSTNWGYKDLAGTAEGAAVDITPVALTEAQLNAAYATNCNVFNTTLGGTFVHPGVMGGGRNADKEGEWIDIVRNIDYITAKTEEQLLSLMLERDIIPMTNGGISIVDNRLKSTLDQFGVKQAIFVEGSVVTSFPKRSEISTTNRDDRILPDGTFSGELQGGVNKVVIRGKVFI